MDVNQTVDFVNDIEFNDIKTETETKEGIVKIKKEKIESPEVKQEGRLAKTDFKQTLDLAKNIEFEGDLQPKQEIKEEKTNSPKVKIEIKKELKVEIKDEPLDVKGEFDDELQKGLLVLDTMDFETRMDTENGQFEAEIELDTAVHEDKKPYECSICNKAFPSKQNLAKHNASIHEKIKQHKCTVCDAKFALKGNLMVHIKGVHENIKPFKCLNCDASFIQKQKLDIHNVAVHEKKKPFKCTLCHFSCSYASNLKQHVTGVHEGKKTKKLYVKSTLAPKET